MKNSVQDLYELRDLFSDRSYREIAGKFGDQDLRKDLATDDDAELYSIFAFSLHHMKEYPHVVPIVEKIIDFIKKRGDEEKAHELYGNTVLISYDSLIKTNAIWKAYRLLKDNPLAVHKNQALTAFNVSIKKLMAQRIISKLSWWLPITSFALVGTQEILGFMNKPVYILLMVFLFISISIILGSKERVEKMLIRLL